MTITQCHLLAIVYLQNKYPLFSFFSPQNEATENTKKCKEMLSAMEELQNLLKNAEDGMLLLSIIYTLGSYRYQCVHII